MVCRRPDSRGHAQSHDPAGHGLAHPVVSARSWRGQPSRPASARGKTRLHFRADAASLRGRLQLERLIAKKRSFPGPALRCERMRKPPEVNFELLRSHLTHSAACMRTPGHGIAGEQGLGLGSQDSRTRRPLITNRRIALCRSILAPQHCRGPFFPLEATIVDVKVSTRQVATRRLMG